MGLTKFVGLWLGIGFMLAVGGFLGLSVIMVLSDWVQVRFDWRRKTTPLNMRVDSLERKLREENK